MKQFDDTRLKGKPLEKVEQNLDEQLIEKTKKLIRENKQRFFK